ncbi:hypothetical protein [Roseisalinus antarcticus]|uniref:Uncharacterized protein n=1 Tax=Roseisalinus antarcticus TaxID=254357 RepID=A0A1Y5RKL7_9RHOB|nr:hypothetical protein [Roseisalinus antarcticus]SLN19810.1 hypothetical protein ROA7023_00488 [Roseisalinus antarcticus]
MKAPANRSVFLARASFRRRRLRDAARMLPILALVLVLMPLLQTGHPEARSSGVLIYLFVLWVLLIAAAAALVRPILPTRDETGSEPEDTA